MSNTIGLTRLPLQLLAPGMLWLLSGCSTMQGVMDLTNAGFEIASDVKDQGRLVYKGKLKSLRTQGGKTSLLFKDGTSYEVLKCDIGVGPGDVIRIYKVEKGFEARQFNLDKGSQVAKGRVQRLDFRSESTVVSLEDGQSFEVDGDVRTQPGAMVAIFKDEFGFSVKPE
jgi:hypothetical protein